MSVHLDIDIDGSEPVRGRVRLDDGQWSEWVGWVALAVIVGEAADVAERSAPEDKSPRP